MDSYLLSKINDFLNISKTSGLFISKSTGREIENRENREFEFISRCVCVNSSSLTLNKQNQSKGLQPDPIPNTHNSGWIQSPGSRIADDLSQRPRLERYVKALMSRFGNDKRIVLWDLYNEPGNGSAGDHFTTSGLRENASMPLLQDVFRWAKEANPIQPLTAAPWKFEKEFDELNRFMFENSEIVTFHCYSIPGELKERINFIRFVANGRPILCTEYMVMQEVHSLNVCQY